MSRAPRLKAAEYAALVGDLSNAADIIDEILREMSAGQNHHTLSLYTPLAAAIHLAIGVSIIPPPLALMYELGRMKVGMLIKRCRTWLRSSVQWTSYIR